MTIDRQLNAAGMKLLIASMPMLSNHFELVEAVAQAVLACGGADLVLTGSLASGTGDIYSDVDFEVVCDSAESRHRVKRAVERCLRQQGRAIAWFPATHLQMPELLIHFLERNDALVKIDVNYLIADPTSQPSVGVYLVATAPFYAMPPATEPCKPQIDVATLKDMQNKFCGWMWYTHTKIARGEYWEAEDALGVMRAKALMPLLQYAQGQPLEGYRRVEQRFGPEDQARLLETRCAHLHPAELQRALLSACTLFEDAAHRVSAKVGHAWQTADLEKMKRFIASGTGQL